MAGVHSGLLLLVGLIRPQGSDLGEASWHYVQEETRDEQVYGGA
ncbi:MAG: hypothetical protein MNPFHGCM_02721 [Gemmatimonadaceae bacterium]|nr:hypothetical protein [Gemmatimonadaceae bacterium]